MKFSLADQLALIYSSAGSIRNVAALTGISHQTVGRILHNAMQGKSNAYYENKPGFTQAVGTAFGIHIDVARAQAKEDRIPFDARYPVFASKLPLRHQAVIGDDGTLLFRGEPENCKRFIAGKPVVFETVNQHTGEIKKRVYQIPIGYAKTNAQIYALPGDRVGALHMHWLPDRIRNAWITANQKSGRYYAASAGSVVNLREYNKRANALANNRAKAGYPRTKSQIVAKHQFQNAIKESDALTTHRVYTQLTSMDPRHIPELVIANLTEKLQSRHSPAVGQPGTILGDRILLQLDTRKTRQHATKHAKTRRNKGGN